MSPAEFSRRGVMCSLAAAIAILPIEAIGGAQPSKTKVVGPEYIQGYPYWTAQCRSCLVSATLLVEGAYSLVFLSVMNTSTERFDVFPERVSFYRIADDIPHEVKRIPPSDYVARIRNKGAWGALLIGLTTAWSLQQPQQSTTHKSYSQSGPTGYTVGSSTTSTRRGPSTQDQVAASEFAVEQARSILQPAIQSADSAESLCLRSTTLRPGQVVTGVVPFRLRYLEGEELWVQVVLNGEVIRLPVEYRRE